MYGLNIPYNYFKFDYTQPYFMVYNVESLPQPFFIWKFNWRQRYLNPGPSEDQSKALPTEPSWLSSNFEFPFNFVFVLIFLTEGKSYLKTLLNTSFVSSKLTLLVDCLSELKILNVLIQMVNSFLWNLRFCCHHNCFCFSMWSRASWLTMWLRLPIESNTNDRNQETLAQKVAQQKM